MKLRRGLGVAMVVASAPSQLTAQTETIDLSGHTLETVIPAVFDGGCFGRIGGIVVSDGGIWVSDDGEAKVLRFDLDGRLRSEYVREHDGPPAPQGGRPATRLGTLAALDNVTPLRAGFAMGPASGDHPFSPAYDHEGDPLNHVLLFHPDGSRLNTVASYHIETERRDSPARLGEIFDPPPGESGAWTSVVDSMAVLVNGVTGMLTRLTVRNGSLVADTFDLSDAGSVATRVLVGRNDEIWVRNAVEGQHEEWDIVEPGSQRRWHVVFPERFELKAVHSRHLYGVLKDELDVPSVVRIADPPRQDYTRKTARLEA